MKKLLMALLGFMISSVGFTRPRLEVPIDIVGYVYPERYSEYTYKFDKSKG